MLGRKEYDAHLLDSQLKRVALFRRSAGKWKLPVRAVIADFGQLSVIGVRSIGDWGSHHSAALLLSIKLDQ